MSAENRVPPNNLEAERGLLGSLMMLPDETIPLISQICPPEYMYLEDNRLIYQAIIDMHGQGINGIDAVTLSDFLGKRLQLDLVGGVPYIARIIDGVPHASHARYYAQLISRDHHARQNIYTAKEVFDRAYGDEDPQDLAMNATNAFSELAAASASEQDSSLMSALMDREDELEKGRVYLPTGISAADKALGGGHLGTQLVVVAARPGMGKTAHVIQMLLHCAKKGISGFLCSLEMSRIEIIDRLISMQSQINGKKVSRPKSLNDAERQRVYEAQNLLAALPMGVDDQSHSMLEIAKQAYRQSAAGCKIFVVDYLQIVDPRDPKAARERQVATMTRELKIIGQKTGMLMVVVSQLNRKIEERKSPMREVTCWVDPKEKVERADYDKPIPRPLLSDLRESGAIEQDANTVIFMNLPYKYPVAGDEICRDRGEIIVAKQRSGDVGILRTSWSAETTSFGNLEEALF